MRLLLSLAAAVAAFALMTAGVAGARHQIPHKSFKTMTAHQREHWLARQAQHDRGALRWIDRHLSKPFPERFLLSTIFVKPHWRAERAWFATSLRIATKHLIAVRAELAAQMVPLILRERGLPLPPAWYLHDIACIEMGESTMGAGSSNLYGMLQGWQAAGGTGYAGDAPAQEQLDRTWILYNMDGWSPWTTAAGCGL